MAGVSCGECQNDGRIMKEARFATWTYYTNDEGKPRWRCSACGKICKRNPHYKQYCSTCGSKMKMEA